MVPGGEGTPKNNMNRCSQGSLDGGPLKTLVFRGCMFLCSELPFSGVPAQAIIHFLFTVNRHSGGSPQICYAPWPSQHINIFDLLPFTYVFSAQ